MNPFRFEMMWSNFCSKNLQVKIMGSFFLTTVRPNYFTPRLMFMTFKISINWFFFLLLSSIRESIVLKIIIDECWEVLNVW